MRYRLHSPNRIFGIATSNIEIRDLITAWVIISIAFAIAFTGHVGLDNVFLTNALIAGLTVGLGFLLHELSHKIIAQQYGCWAEFRADRSMLFFALLVSFLGFVFAAPGAVLISGRVRRDANGKISVAGPLMNLFLAFGFLVMGFLYSSPIISQISKYGFIINVWLGLFNMLPFWIFDGRKVWDWNKVVWGVVVAVAVGLFFVGGASGI